MLKNTAKRSVLRNRQIFRVMAPIVTVIFAACSSGESSSPDLPEQAPNDGQIPDTIDTSDIDTPIAPSADLGGDTFRGIVGLDERPSNQTCLAPQRPVTTSDIRLQRVWPNLSFNQPLKLLQMPATAGEENRWYVLEQEGKVLTFDGSSDSVPNATVALDYSEDSDSEVKVQNAEDAGLLGMTFHPDFATTGEAFLSYTAEPGNSDARHESRVTRILSLDGGLTLDGSTESIVMAIDQPFRFHNVGDLGFGPDGYLYIGAGDGGNAGDPLNNAQNPDSLLGKFLRIDVDSASPYAIPPDNPYANGGGRPEVFAMGLRNPWRWSFDRFSNELWAGDVGQSNEEEVNLIRRGENYGWRCYEGNSSFDESNCLSRDNYTAPVIAYEHDEGSSVTGGYVYRGERIPGMFGDYIYGDFVSGTIWALTPDGSGNFERRELIQSGLGLASFSEGSDGELYVVDYFGGGLYKIVSGSADANGNGPALALSATGCVDPASPSIPATGVIPYGVRHAFWSDGVDKQRFIALPDGSSADIDQQGDFEFPMGTVLMKHFRLGDQLIETRFFVHHDDGDWAGYTYEWNDAQTDAMLLPGSKEKRFGDQVWRYPSRAQCLECHTEAAGVSLGLEVRQLDAGFSYPATQRTGNQIDTLHHVGLVSENATESMRASPLQSLDDSSASLNVRARSYLHVNCASCHQPGGTTRANMDLRFDTPMAQTGTCDTEPSQASLDITDPKLIARGSPESSVLLARLQADDSNRMPPIGNTVVDQAAVDLLREWIVEGADCPTN